MVRAVLCDIDGTLLDSNWLHAAAWKDSFAEMGLDIPLEEIRRQIGKGGSELIPVFVPWWMREAVEQPLKDFREFHFRDRYLQEVRPFPKVRELLKCMKQAGIKISLATSANRSEIEAYKKIADIEDLVEEETSSDDAERSKPYPDIFEATLRELKVEAKNALALGDTPYDAEAAGLAGVMTVGVTTGGWSETDLLRAGCVEVYRDVAQLVEDFEQSAFVRA